MFQIRNVHRTLTKTTKTHICPVLGGLLGRSWPLLGGLLAALRPLLDHSRPLSIGPLLAALGSLLAALGASGLGILSFTLVWGLGSCETTGFILVLGLGSCKTIGFTMFSLVFGTLECIFALFYCAFFGFSIFGTHFCFILLWFLWLFDCKTWLLL